MDINQARQHVVLWYQVSLRKEIEQDLFASHVTKTMKEEYFTRKLQFIDELAEGKHDTNLTVAQRMNYYMTGEMVPLLSF